MSHQNKTTFTTHEVSRFLGVSLQTVVNWIDSGRLEGFKTAGGHRRVSRDALLLFMRRQALPVPREVLLSDRKSPRVLVLEGNVDLVDVFREYLVWVGKYEVNVVETVFDAGWMANSLRPDVFVLDLDLKGLQVRRLIRSLKSSEELRAMPLIGLSGGRSRPSGLHSLLPRPVPMLQLVGAIEDALGG